MDIDDGFLADDGEDEEEEGGTAYPPDPCPRCGRTHVALFFGERYRTFEIQAPMAGLRHNFFSQASARVAIRTCMDCGYIELYREELLRQHD